MYIATPLLLPKLHRESLSKISTAFPLLVSRPTTVQGWPPEIPRRVFLALRHFSRWSFLDPLFPTTLLHARVFQRSELLEAIHSASLGAAFALPIRLLFPYAPEAEAGSLRDHPGSATRLAVRLGPIHRLSLFRAADGGIVAITGCNCSH